jgi:hypothetical protein
LPFGTYPNDYIPLEINGEADLEGLSPLRRIEHGTERDWIKMSFMNTKRKHPRWKMPELKFRLIEQFLMTDTASYEGL